MDRLESTLYTLVIVVFFLTLCIVGLNVKKKLTPHQLSLPPGPRGLPVLGSALEINRSKPWLTFVEWKASYGDLVSCKVLGQLYVIINSEKVAKTMLEQCSNNHSSRPVVKTCSPFGMDSDLPCNNTRSSHRNSPNGSTIHRYHHLVAGVVRILLGNLLHSPGNFENHMKTYATSIIMSIMYGYNVSPTDDPLEPTIEETIVAVSLMTPERVFLLYRFPQLLSLPPWFPGAQLRQLVKRCRELSPWIRDALFQFTEESLSEAIKNDSMVTQPLKNKSQDRNLHEQHIKDCATSNFIAGTFAMQSILSTLIMALILHPEVQDHAQAQVDRIAGRDRLPTLNDRTSLQYIDALLRESLRWGSLVPMAIPWHVTTKDVILEQRLIPEGSIIIQNLWDMARDEESSPRPTAFEPERHLDTDGNLLPDDASGLCFGCGHSFCPGRYLADASTWLAAANMISRLRFSKAIGPAGYEIDVFPKFTGDVVRRPVPFSCHITPRFEETMGSIKA